MGTEAAPAAGCSIAGRLTTTARTVNLNLSASSPWTRLVTAALNHLAKLIITPAPSR
jgi:hypothetical protein